MHGYWRIYYFPDRGANHQRGGDSLLFGQVLPEKENERNWTLDSIPRAPLNPCNMLENTWEGVRNDFALF